MHAGQNIISTHYVCPHRNSDNLHKTSMMHVVVVLHLMPLWLAVYAWSMVTVTYGLTLEFCSREWHRI